MIVYHFTSAEYGISNIANKRLKVAEIDKLNDPYDLMAFDTSDRGIRNAFNSTKAAFAEIHGITCFSRKWDNPVQWAHYGDRHRGIALGLEIPDKFLTPVKYLEEPLLLERQTLQGGKIGSDTMLKILTSKFFQWSYEDELRGFYSFSEADKLHRSVGLPIFQSFSETLKLKEVILGTHISKDNELKVQMAVSAFGSNLELIKARLAFRSFSIVGNKRYRRRNIT